MSFALHTRDGQMLYAEEEKFHRVTINPNDELRITASDKPVAIWVSSNYSVRVTSDAGATVDVAEIVEHHDIVSMEKKLHEMRREKKRAEQRERQARRRLRRLDRVPNA